MSDLHRRLTGVGRNPSPSRSDHVFSEPLRGFDKTLEPTLHDKGGAESSGLGRQSAGSPDVFDEFRRCYVVDGAARSIFLVLTRLVRSGSAASLSAVVAHVSSLSTKSGLGLWQTAHGLGKREGNRDPGTGP